MAIIDTANFIKLRENAGLSQRKLSLKAGLSASTVSKIELTGRAVEDSLKKIADVLGVSVSDLTKDGSSQISGVHEKQVGYGDPSSRLFQLTTVRIARAGLKEYEIEEMRHAISMIVDIYTSLDIIEREKHAQAITGIIKLCHSMLFHPGGREKQKLSGSQE